MTDNFSTVGIVAALSLMLSPQTGAADGVVIQELIVAAPTTEVQSDATIAAARAFYDFWNTGDETFLKLAIAPTFVDRTLPPGRPQGPAGPAFASHQFRAAVPDLKVTVEKMIVASNYVTVHMRFTGHFRGKFGSVQGAGQAISFIATDLVKVEGGRITENWHIEDNLTLFQQMGVAKVAS